MRFFRRSLMGLLMLALTLALLGLAAMTVGSAIRASIEPGGPARPAAERVVSANVMTIEPGEITPQLTAYGKLEARRALDVRTRSGGTVIWVADSFRNGGEVAEGDLLFRLDPVPAENAVALARADLTEARAAGVEALAAVDLAVEDLAAAEAQAVLRRQALERQQGLVERGAGSPQAVETAELAMSSADQAVLSRKQALATARARVDQTIVAVTRAEIAERDAARALTETEVRAGLGGRVVGVSLTPGAIVTANEAVGRILDPSALDVALRLSAAQYAQLVDDSGTLRTAEVSVSLPGLTGGRALGGRLERVAAAVAEGQTGRLVYASLDPDAEAQALLKPGDFVSVSIGGAPLADAALIPATAVGRQGTVLTVGPEDRLEEQAVEILGRQGDEVIVRVGPLAGDEIVSERSALLGEGIRIRPLRPGAVAEDAVKSSKPMGG
ncbi:MAG: HlyD family efflux transporter periplasmic adaptor subunit [Tabrizicola sp.]|jgi:multidrug efflux pump subunit AcrA (membrane-fusion protein)|nr:HlyD family efflux transporter periplasmic adaptor subunit [Tabrizicola sp.]